MSVKISIQKDDILDILRRTVSHKYKLRLSRNANLSLSAICDDLGTDKPLQAIIVTVDESSVEENSSSKTN